MRICPHCQAKTEAEFCPDDGTITVPEELFAAAPDPLLGKVLNGRYRIDRCLGVGGMGAVYVGEQISVQREVAIKVILSEFAKDPNNIKRFHREALATSKLTHPNIVYLHDFGQTPDGILYIVMEHLKGCTLQEEISQRGAIPEDRLVRIAAQMFRALHHAHHAGVIHRDLKTANVFLVEGDTESDLVKVLDFGIAKILSRDTGASDITKTGITVGSPAYMAPEQAMNKGVDARSDLYSVGVILYEAATGSPPFEGSTPLEIILKHINEPAPEMPPNEHLPWAVSPELRGLIRSLLDKDQEKRPADALAALRLLPGYADAEISSQSAPRPVVRDPSASREPSHQPERPAVLPSTPPPMAVAPTRVTSSGDALAALVEEDLRAPRGTWKAVVALLLVALGFGGYLVWRFILSPEPPAPAPAATAQVDKPGPAPQASPSATPEVTALAVKPTDAPPASPEAAAAEVSAPRATPEVVPAAEAAAQAPGDTQAATVATTLVTSVPTGAKVYVGELEKGSTPYTLSGPAGQAVELRLVKLGFKVRRQAVTIGAQPEVQVTLQPQVAPAARQQANPAPGPSPLDRIGVPAPAPAPAKSLERL
jgi:serine/threonine-protein kinase